ncbi:MAG: T9SS type A sorting domain-containing protein [Bacteroidota bacterium]|nr:T9SS type A sorting domain-containing protein [Bacteroidota bacterium]
MRKIIFVLLAGWLTAGFGYSQSLSLSSEGIDISNDTLYLIGKADAVLESHVSVTNKTDKEIEVLVRRTDIEIVDGTDNSFCWGVSCYPPFISEATQVVKIAANSTDDNSFIGDYSPGGNEGTSVLKYTFFIEATPADSVTVIVYYQVGAAGVRDWTLDPSQIKLYPNPASDEVTVRFPTVLTQITELVLIDITGQTVYKQTLYHGAQIHRLSLSQFPQGNYFLLISDQQGANHSKKLIINR